MALDATITNTNGDKLEITKDPNGYAIFTITPNGSQQSFALNIDRLSLAKLARSIPAAMALIDNAS